jgi:hypothetical protein
VGWRRLGGLLITGDGCRRRLGLGLTAACRSRRSCDAAAMLRCWWLGAVALAVTVSGAHAPRQQQRRWLAGNGSGGSSGGGGALAAAQVELPAVDAVENKLASQRGKLPAATVASRAASHAPAAPAPGLAALPSVDAVEALLRERWADGPPPPLSRDAPPPPAKRPPPPPPPPSSDPCRGGPPCPPGTKPASGARGQTQKAKTPLKATNLTGAFRGTWTLPQPAPAGPFFVTDGSVLHQIKSWKTNATNVQYLQSALLLRDGAYSTSHDSRVSLEGVYLHKEGKVAMFSRQGSQFFTTKAAANISSVATGFLQRTRQARHYAEKQPRFTQEHFTTSFTNSRCSFFVLLDVDSRLTPTAERSSWAALGLSTQSASRPRTKMTGQVFSPECSIDMAVAEELMDYDEYYSTVFLYTVVVMCTVTFQIILFVKQMESSQTQASITRVSPFTIALQAGMDAFLCLMHLTTGIIVEALFNAFAICAFCKFILCAMFEMRYFTQVWKAQLPTGAWPDAETERREISRLHTRFYSICIALIVAGYKFPGALTMPLMLLGFSFWCDMNCQRTSHHCSNTRPAQPFAVPCRAVPCCADLI